MNCTETDVDYDDVFAQPGVDAMPALPDLARRTVFITGAGSGIGAYLAAAFALQGARVGFVSLTDGPAGKLCDAIEARIGQRPLAIRADIRDIAALSAAIERVTDTFGAVEVLINNAARDTRHSLTDWTCEQWDDSLATNLRPHFFSAQAVASGMRRIGRGSIINVGSNSFNLGLAGYPAYVAAKGAVVGLTRALARELGADGIRVNALIPGWVMTARQRRLWVTDDALGDCLGQQALKRPLHGWDIAGPALFLASSASAMVTGQELIVDGGRA